MDQLQQHLDRAHKAFALKNWEQAVDAFAQALELSSVPTSSTFFISFLAG